MFLKPTERRSISSQLVILFTVAATLLLSCGLGVFYSLAVRQAFEEDNAVLLDKIAAIRARLTSPEALTLFKEQVATVRPGEAPGYWIRLLDSTGGLLAESPGMRKLVPPDAFPTQSPGDAASLHPKNVHKNGKLLSLVAASEMVARQPITIQVAQDRSADEDFTKRFGALLAVVLSLGILAAAIIAVSVTRRGLRPLGEMTEAVKGIGPTQLHDRLGVTKWPAELQPMAAAFDETLDRLEDSFTRLSQFSADLAHELRTPVANILGEAEVSLTRERTPQEYRDVIESCVAESTRLSAMIETLLFLARAESADRQIQPSLIDGREAIEKIAAYYEPAATERQVAICCEGEGRIRADPLLFGRAISNLVENALRFSPDGGKIVVRLKTGTGSAEVCVQDNGTGIPADHLSRVFDRFYRVDSSRAPAGSGLGLALVKSISQLHGGSVSIASEEGRGTTVTLRFPA